MVLNKRKVRKELIEELEKNYLLQSACSKLGITRSTVYRWMKEDKEFDRAVKLAQSIGRKFMSDYTESKLFKNIEHQDQRAIEFWLKNNNERYKTRDGTSIKIIENLRQELQQSQYALSAVGSRNIYSGFIDVNKVTKYLKSPEFKEAEMLRKGINTGYGPRYKEIMDQVRKILVQMEIAKYAKDEGLLPEEDDEFAD